MSERFRQAVGPYDNHCDWYGNPESDATRHVLVPMIGVAHADPSLVSKRRYMSECTEQIMAYDNAEVLDTYIGQINMIVVSSFTREFIWGYHLVPPEEGFISLSNGPTAVVDGGRSIPLFSAEPILDASRALFGTKNAKRFPIAAGSMVNAAAKWKEEVGQTHLYAAIGIGIVENPSLSAAHLLMEDVGVVPPEVGEERFDTHFVGDIVGHMGERIRDIQHNQGVQYKEILVAWRHAVIPEGHMGCALVAAPYITLAKSAVFRDNGSIRPIDTMTRQQWEQDVFGP